MEFGTYCILLREDTSVEINNDTHFESVSRPACRYCIGRFVLLLLRGISVT